MDKILFSSEKMDWCTPQAFFDRLDVEFHFVLDAAATKENAKCQRFFTPDDDALAQSWDCGGAVFCNPPYGRDIGRWCKKAWEESREMRNPVVMLIPARTDTRYFHDYIYGKAEVRFVRGRLKFEDEKGAVKANAPFPSMVVIWR